MSDKSQSFYERAKKFTLQIPPSVSTPARITAMCLWLHAHEDGGGIFVGVNRLRHYTGLGASAQFEALRVLVERGYLLVDGWERHASGAKTRRRKLDAARMAFDTKAELGGDIGLCSPPTDEEWDEAPSKGGAVSQAHTPENRSDHTPENRIEHTPENRIQTEESKPKREEPKKEKVLSPRAEDLLSSCSLDGAAGENATDLAQKAFDLYNRRAGGKLQKALKLDSTRRDKLKRRLKEYFDNDLAQWDEYLITMTSRPFLCGQNERGWRADFAFALRPEAILKILEGGYVDRDPTRDANGFTHVRTPL